MVIRHHAIAPGARQTSFWPSIAMASAQLRSLRTSRIGREQSEDPAVLRLSSPDAIVVRRLPGGLR
jgi:hypothetical protein